MRRVAGLNYRTLAIGVTVVVLAGLVLGSAGLGSALSASSHAGKSSSAASSPSAARASPTPAAQGQATTTITVGIVYAPGATFPTNISFYTNITWGVISDATTFVVVTANTSTVTGYAVNLSGTVVSANVSSNVINGVPYANYTWTAALTEASLTCTDASCSDLIVDSANVVTFTIEVTEYGHSAGGQKAVQDYAVYDTMLTTYVSAGFVLPATNETTGTTYAYNVPFNFTVELWVNSSYLAATNAAVSAWLLVEDDTTGIILGSVSLNWSIGTTVPYDVNPASPTGIVTANGTSYTGYWANITYIATLNSSALNLTWAELVADLGGGNYLTIVVGTSVDGTSVGGIAPGAEAVFYLDTISGTTLAYGGYSGLPVSYQALPYTQYGWLNLSSVPFGFATWNSTYTGYFVLVDGPTVLASWDVNDSANTTLGTTFSLEETSNGTSALGTQWVNFTWALTILPSDITSGAYGDELTLLVNFTAYGGTVTGIDSWLSAVYGIPYNIQIWTDTLAQHPTVVSAAFTTPVTGYIDVSTTAFNLGFTLSVTNASITNASTTILVSVVDATIPAPIYVYQVALLPGQTSFVFPVTAATVSTCNPLLPYPGTGVDGVPFVSVCPYTAPTDDFYFTLSVEVNGIGAPMNGSVAYSTVSIGPAFFIAQDATISILSPAGQTPSLLTGNVTFATFYQGDYISGANLTVYLGTVPVFTAVMTQLEAGVPATSVWDATAAGTYSIVVAMTRTSGGPVYDNITLTIASSASTTVYINSSTYHNVTLLGSLSPAVAGTILLLVGLIVGMIVALLVGRMMWGGSKQQEPPQQWQQGQQPGTTGSTDSSAGGTMDSGSTPPPSGGT